MRPVERRVYARADALLASSPPYVEGSVALTRARAKVAVVPFGIDLAPFARVAEDAVAAVRARHPGPIWLSVGRLIYYKALDVALRALRDVPGTLIVVGVGPMDAAWRRLAAELGVAERVVFRGAVGFDELVVLYHAATALWFPSDARSEAFGIVQVEAMAAGCPVINAQIPKSGVPWVSPHEETGLTVPVDDPAALSAAARRLVGDPALRARLSVAARVAAHARFDHRAMARRILDLYEEILAGRRGRRATALSRAAPRVDPPVPRAT
jgi:rhamnosyl/mannosyltransferase